MLVGIELVNYALFSHLSVGMTAEGLEKVQAYKDMASLYPLGQLVAVVGRNDSGKSTLFAALDFLSDCLVHDVPYAAASGRRGGFFELKRKDSHGPMRLITTFKKNKTTYYTYELALNADRHNRPFVESESVNMVTFKDDKVVWTNMLAVAGGRGHVLSQKGEESVELADKRHLALAAYGKLLNYTDLCWLYARISRWFISCDKMAEDTLAQQTKGGHRHVSSRFDNIRNVLEYWKGEDQRQYNQLIDYIKDRVPDFKRIGDAFLDHDLRSGSMRLFTLILLFSDPNPRPLLCLDHPDANLYHDAIETLTFEMREYLRKNPSRQIFITTHSAYTIENLRPGEVYLFSRPAENGSTKAYPVGQSEKVKAMLKQGIGMSAIWYGGYFEPESD